MLSISDYLAACRPLILQAMRDTMGLDPSLATQVASYHLGWTERDGSPRSQAGGGKGLRGGLAHLVGESLGGGDAALPAAASVELFHAMTLLHDDVMDRDRRRRGQPAAWTIWGDATAINAGDLLFARAFTAIAGSERAAEGTRLLAAGAATVVFGQQLDLQFEARARVGLAEYEQMIGAKTAALFGLALELGALAAGAERGPWRRLGNELGMAFQIRDDELGIWGDPAVTGKPVGGDLRRGKKSLPMVMFQTSGGQLPGPADSNAQVLHILGQLESAGIRGQVQAALAQKIANCRRLTGLLPVQTSYRSMLQQLIDRLAERER